MKKKMGSLSSSTDSTDDIRADKVMEILQYEDRRNKNSTRLPISRAAIIKQKQNTE